MNEFEAKIHAAISNSLPGENAHIPMNPSGRNLSSEAKKKATNIRESAVAIVMYKTSENHEIVLIQRPDYIGAHGGQISFPGGKRDLEDEDLKATAMRECKEEIGISLEEAAFLGQMTPVYIPVSNFHVEPYLFYYDQIPNFVKDEREVSAIFSISVVDLLHDGTISKMEIDIQGDRLYKDIPCFLINEKKIWGATALILSELKEVLQMIQ
ncbi:MAG: CoA pyrophosphatase [Crocinitomicaceae bacterium]|nr:CoA pyrophosphatase [Crocinitomicaceae bacterium]